MAFTALFRPGPMMPEKTINDAGEVINGPSILDHYIERRHNREPVDVWHPSLEEVYRDTYGMPIYQESLMSTARILAGFTPEEADLMRVAIGKKLKDKYAAILVKFIEGCVKQGHDKKWAEGIAQRLEGSGRYNWSSSHACVYGLIIYVMSYLEAHHPVAYYTAILNSAIDDSKKLPILLSSIAQHGVKILPPHINKSETSFVTDGKDIYMGIQSVHGIGPIATAAIIQERATNGPFASFVDFCRRCPPKDANSAVKAKLVEARAFDWDTSWTAKDKLENLSNLVKVFKKTPNASDIDIMLKCVITGEEYDDVKLLHKEHETLRCYITNHPVSLVSVAIPHIDSMVPIIGVAQFDECEVNNRYIILGLVTSIETKLTKYNKPFVAIKIQDQFASMTFRLFQDGLVKYAQTNIASGHLVMVSGITVHNRFDQEKLDINIDQISQISNGLPITALVLPNTDPYYNNLGINSVSLIGDRVLGNFNTQHLMPFQTLPSYISSLRGAKMVISNG
jgi:DNA polymerase-3 subunit alpha